MSIYSNVIYKPLKSYPQAATKETMNMKTIMNMRIFNELLRSTTGELINIIYNRYASDLSDYALFPCVGLVWYDVDFAGKHIAICDTGNYIGITDHTKLDFPYRILTRKEVDILISFIDETVKEKRTSKDYGTERDNIDKILIALDNWIQSLSVRQS